MDYLVFIQNLRLASAGVFDSFMLETSKLGESLVTFLLAAFVYWCVDKRTGQLMAFNISFACWLNQWTKKIFKIERPWVRDTRITPVESAIPGASGYSMPSGHTTRSVATWGSLGYETYKKGKSIKDGYSKWLSLCSLIIVLLIMFSRNYLGVHTFSDVIVAFIVGIIFIVGIDCLLKWVEADKEGGVRDIIISLIGCIVLVLPMLRFGCLSNAGAGYGFVIGWVLERRFVRFDVDSKKDGLKGKVLRFVPGALVIFLCFTSGTSVLSHILPEKYAGFFLQGFAAFFIVFLYPIFIKIWDNDALEEKKRCLCKKIIWSIVIALFIVGAIILGLRIKAHYIEVAYPDNVVDSTGITPVETDNRVKVIAHRGYSGIAPENTLASFERAIDIGADFIELDVQLTKDNKIVVFHDTDMARITGVAGEIGNYTYDELCELDAGSWFIFDNTGMTYEGEQVNYSGEKIPTLKEALELIGGSDLNIYLELKDISADSNLSPEQRAAFAGMVVDEVDANGMTDRVIYASFNYEYLCQIKNKNNNNLILCNTSIGDADRLLKEFPADYYGVNAEVLGQDTIGKLHKGGAKVYVWTVNTPSQIRQIIKLGADGIVTNYPGMANVVVHDEYRFLADNYINSIMMPGLYDYSMNDRNVTSIDDCTKENEQNKYSSYVAQGFTKAGGYLVVSAYDYSGEKNSILYIMNTAGRLIDVVDLGFKAHTGGIAYDEAHDFLWVTAADGKVVAISWSSVVGGMYTGGESEILVCFDAGLVNHNDLHVASFLSLYAGKLYVGSYCDGITGKLNEYDLSDVYNPVLVTQYDIPQRIQGVTFDYEDSSNSVTMLMTQGYNVEDAALLSVKFEEGRNDYSVVDNMVVLPEGAEQPLMTSSGLYIIFESSSRVYRYDARCVNDQIWLVNVD